MTHNGGRKPGPNRKPDAVHFRRGGGVAVMCKRGGLFTIWTEIREKTTCLLCLRKMKEERMTAIAAARRV